MNRPTGSFQVASGIEQTMACGLDLPQSWLILQGQDPMSNEAGRGRGGEGCFLQPVSSGCCREEASSSGCSDTDSTELASIL